VLYLGYHSQNYKPDHIDFTAYESVWHQFLSSPQGCATMLMGSIVAHLIRELINYDDVLYGPLEGIFQDGLCLWDGTSSTAYWDDQLTKNEINLVCGVYNADTGELTI
jgi:hypothetical protein